MITDETDDTSIFFKINARFSVINISLKKILTPKNAPKAPLKNGQRLVPSKASLKKGPTPDILERILFRIQIRLLFSVLRLVKS